MLVILNAGESDAGDLAGALAKAKFDAWKGKPHVAFSAVSAPIEQEIAAMSPEDQAEFLKGLGLPDRALDRLLRAAYDLLGLMSFLTAGEDECRAWSIPKGTTPRRPRPRSTPTSRSTSSGPRSSRSTTLMEAGSFANCKTHGTLRLEGRTTSSRTATSSTSASAPTLKGPVDMKKPVFLAAAAVALACAVATAQKVPVAVPVPRNDKAIARIPPPAKLHIKSLTIVSPVCGKPVDFKIEVSNLSSGPFAGFGDHRRPTTGAVFTLSRYDHEQGSDAPARARSRAGGRCRYPSRFRPSWPRARVRRASRPRCSSCSPTPPPRTFPEWDGVKPRVCLKQSCAFEITGPFTR